MQSFVFAGFFPFDSLSLCPEFTEGFAQDKLREESICNRWHYLKFKTMIVGICKLDLIIPACRSLKEKRQVLRRVKDRTANEFGIRVSEVDYQDKWQRAELGFATVGNEHGVIEGILQRMINFIGDMGVAEIIDQRIEIINV